MESLIFIGVQLSTVQYLFKMGIKSKLNERGTTESFKIKDDWDKQASALRTKYPTLSSEDVKFEIGKEEELYKRVENRLGKTRDQVIGILNNIHKDVIEVA